MFVRKHVSELPSIKKMLIIFEQNLSGIIPIKSQNLV